MTDGHPAKATDFCNKICQKAEVVGLFDHLVGAGKQRLRDREAEGLRGL
jgi:hypothetical protein